MLKHHHADNEPAVVARKMNDLSLVVVDDAPSGSADDSARQFPGVMIHMERTTAGVFSSADRTLLTEGVQKKTTFLTGRQPIRDVASRATKTRLSRAKVAGGR